MIRFACYCGHPFELEDAQAAGLVQCPACGKLNDVPTLADLANLNEQGVIQLKPVEIEEQPQRLATLSRIYAKGRKDEQGNDIDLRQTPEDFTRRGEPIARGPAQIIRPRYDPETGQLIRPIDVAPPLPPAAIPVKPAPLRYVRPETFRTEPLGLRALLRGANLFSMFCVALVMAFAGIFAMLVYIPLPNPAGGPPTHMLMWIGPMVILELLILAHYGNCIEELGPQYRDELPRLLGDVMFYENVWMPLMQVVQSLLLCYLPAVLAFNVPSSKVAIPLGSLLAGAGTYFFPAVLLTMTTSGSYSNLRLDRLMGTISACGTIYLWSMLSWIVAGSIYLLAFLRFVLPVMGHLHPIAESLPDIVTMLVMIPVIHVITVPIAHVFTWQTAMLYRRYYVAFPWVGQRHEKEPAGSKETN